MVKFLVIFGVFMSGTLGLIVSAFIANLYKFEGTKLKTRMIYGLVTSIWGTSFILLLTFSLSENKIPNILKGSIMGIILSIPLYYYSKTWIDRRIEGAIIFYSRKNSRYDKLFMLISMIAIITLPKLISGKKFLGFILWIGFGIGISWFLSQSFILYWLVRLEKKLGKTILEGIKDKTNYSILKESKQRKKSTIMTTICIFLVLSLLLTVLFRKFSINSQLPKIEWQKTFGGQNWDYAYDIKQTEDEGYVVAGYTVYNNNNSDAYVVKLDSAGNKIWDKTFGGKAKDIAYAIQQTKDGGYILAGYLTSFNTKCADLWVIKLDSSGNKIWNKTFGGKAYDEAHSIQQTKGGGYIVAGDTKSYGNGKSDFYIIKLDSLGSELWNKTFGGANFELCSSIQQTIDGGYIAAGYTFSYAIDSADFYVIKLDSAGNKIWDKTFGDKGFDSANSIQQTKDGGYIVAGGIDHSKKSTMFPNTNAWILKLDVLGNTTWSKSLGGKYHNDRLNFIQQTIDGGYIAAGYTFSYGAGTWWNLLKLNAFSKNNFWVIKLDSSGNKIWDKTFGGKAYDEANCIKQTKDGGYVIVGATQSYGVGSSDFLVIKLITNKHTKPLRIINSM